MTPSNPDNQQPLIYRIADALGVFHLVAPVNHTHSQAEIDGLESALAGKADKNELGNDETFVQIDNDTLRLSGSQKIVLGIFDPDDEFVEIRNDNIQNLRRALTNPDSTPTASSNNLVTSGGVKTAIDLLSGIVQGYYHRQRRYIEGQEMLGGFYLKEWVADNSHRAFVIKNEDDTGDVITVADLVDLDAGETIIYLGSSSSISADENEYLYFDVYRRSTKYYINALKG